MVDEQRGGDQHQSTHDIELIGQLWHLEQLLHDTNLRHQVAQILGGNLRMLWNWVGGWMTTFVTYQK